MDILSKIFMDPVNPFIFALYILISVFFVRVALKSTFGYIVSLLMMVLIPALLLSVMPFLLYFIGFMVGDIPWRKLFLISSSIHFLFIIIILFFYKKKEHWIKLAISFCMALYTYQSMYVDRYIETWKGKNIVNPIHYMGRAITIKDSKKKLPLNRGESVKLKQEIKNTLYQYDKNPKNNYNTSQGLVRIILNKASLSKSPMPNKNIVSVLKDKYSNFDAFDTWQKPNISSLKIYQEQFDILRKYVMQKPNISYSYKVQMVDNKAIIIVTSSDRKKMRLLFYLSKSDTWYVDRIITRPAYDKKLVHMYGDVSDIYMEVTTPNPKLLSYYKQEFDSAMKDFILAKNEYEVFKARVKYGFALKCMKQYGEWYKYLDYSKHRMLRIAKELNSTKKLEKNLNSLNKIYSNKLFSTIEKIQNGILLKNSQDSVETLYQIFITKYFKQSVNDHRMLSNFLEDMYFKYEPIYIQTLKWVWVHHELINMKFNKYRTNKILQSLETNLSINKKINFKKMNNKNTMEYPIVLATSVCNYTIVKELLERGAKLDTSILGKSILNDVYFLYCDNIDILKLLIENGANINEKIPNTPSYYKPNLSWLMSNLCEENGQKIKAYLKELHTKEFFIYDKVYNKKTIEKKLNSCNDDWNDVASVMNLPRGFIYTNKYISREKLKVLFSEDRDILDLIDSFKDIKIKNLNSISYNGNIKNIN